MREMSADRRGQGWWWADNAIVDRIREIGCHALAVYCALARRANTDNQCWPSIRRMAEDLGLDRKTVIRGLARLEVAGMIHREAQFHPDGTQSANVYVLVRLVQLSQAPPRQTGGGPPHETGGGPPRQTDHKQDPLEQDPLNKEERGARGKRAHPLPQPFELTEERRKFATVGGLEDVGLVFGHFKDHHRAKGTLFKDWDAAWRTWCRREADIRAQRQGGRR